MLARLERGGNQVLALQCMCRDVHDFDIIAFQHIAVIGVNRGIWEKFLPAMLCFFAMPRAKSRDVVAGGFIRFEVMLGDIAAAD